MTLKTFIQTHRKEIDKVIRAEAKARGKSKERTNDYIRRLYVLEYATLRRLAEVHGVKF